MRFDWYAATVSARPADVVEGIRGALGGEVRCVRGLHGYRQGWEVVGSSGDAVARVLAGGNPLPHAWASGEVAESFVAVVRGLWPGRHYVTRMDAAEDFVAPGTYELLRDVLREVASARGVKGREIVPEDLDEGRTFYEGAPSSDVRVRLYEKGKQVLRQLPAGRRTGVSPDWVRLEVQVRPKRSGRVVAASCSPAEAWGWSRWSHEVAKRALSLDVPRFDGRHWRPSDDERSFHFLVKQYGPLLARMEARLGSWCAVGEAIGRAVGEASGE